MPSLDDSQAMTMRALDRGPQCLDLAMFAGSPQRVLAGMKVHANTISHARLVALEQTFPRTRDLVGDSRFNSLSRQYIDELHLPSCTLALTGAAFPQFLDQVEADSTAIDMARFEWLWLESYHAGDACPLALADLAGIDPAGLVALEVACHPATRIGCFGRSLHRILAQEIPRLERAGAIMLTRPASQVLIFPASPAMVVLLSLAKSPVSLGNLLAALTEQDIDRHSAAADPMEAIAFLLQAGALVRADELNEPCHGKSM